MFEVYNLNIYVCCSVENLCIAENVLLVRADKISESTKYLNSSTDDFCASLFMISSLTILVCCIFELGSWGFKHYRIFLLLLYAFLCCVAECAL